MANARKRRFEPEEGRGITIGGRDLDVFEALANHSYLTTTQLTLLTLGREASTWQRQWFQKRLRRLFDAGYVDKPRSQVRYFEYGSGDRDDVYCLCTMGARIYEQRRGISLGKTRWYTKSTIGQDRLAHAVSLSTFMVNLKLACRAHGRVQLIHQHQLAVESGHSSASCFSWGVSFQREGEQITLGIKPDQTFALEFPGRPAHRRRAYFFYEEDRGSETILPTNRSNYNIIHRESIYRKILLYDQTFRQNLHKKLFGFPNARVIFVTTGRERAEHFIEKAAGQVIEEQTNPRWKREFLFGNATSITAENVLNYAWMNHLDHRPIRLCD